MRRNPRSTGWIVGVVVGVVVTLGTGGLIALTPRPASAAEPVGTVVSYPGPDAGPLSIAAGADGNLWFTGFASNTIGRMTPSGTVTNFSNIPSGATIVAGPDSNLWFTEANNGAIGRITPLGEYTEFADGRVVSPWGITKGPDRNLWFTMSGSSSAPDNKPIGRISPAGLITPFLAPLTIRGPVAIVAGPDGNLWFTNRIDDSIGRITPTGFVRNFTHSSINGPWGITGGPDGNLWFTNQDGNSIGRITPTGVVTSFTHPSINGPREITTGADGNRWFTNQDGNSIGRITPAGVVTNFTHPSIDEPTGITNGPGGNLWFTNFGADTIGRIVSGPGVFRISTLPALPRGDVGHAYRTYLQATAGTPPYRWKKLSKLPQGLHLKGSTGVISGTLKAPGTTTFTIQASYKEKVKGARAVKHTTTRVFSLTGYVVP